MQWAAFKQECYLSSQTQNLQGLTLAIMLHVYAPHFYEAASSSNTSTKTSQTTWPHIPEN
jgi:hypothetical protein